MQARSGLTLVFLGAVQLVVLLPIGLLDPLKFPDVGGFRRSHAIAIVLGCGFAQASVAAAWMALGPLSINVRGPASAVWALTASLLLTLNIVVNSPGNGVWEGILLGGTLVGVWLVAQAPLWVARGTYRFQIHLLHEVDQAEIAAELQFGIRQLLVVTAAVGATLGLGRLLILGFESEGRWGGLGGPRLEMLVVVGLFVVCNSLVAFTVITAALLRRHWLFGLALGLCAANAVTLVEWTLFASLVSGLDKWEALEIVGGMNGLQFSWLLFSLVILRSAGYRLVGSALPTTRAC